MARIRHIALTTDDPPKTAEFYKTHLGLTELFRQPSDTGKQGVFLSDGYIYVAIINMKYSGDGTPRLGTELPTVLGIDHIGFQVDDLEEACNALKAANVTYVEAFSSPPNRRFQGPEGVMFDIRQRGWDERIQARMQLLQLATAPRANKKDAP